MLIHEEITEQIIASAIEVHTILGPGLLESVYEECMSSELTARGLAFGRQAPIPIQYKGQVLEAGFKADLVVEKKVIVELKSVQKTLPIHEAQVLTYLKLSGIRVGLLINFNERRVADGILRRAL